VVTPRQGEIWWAEAEDNRRPVLIVSRSEVIPVIEWVIVAPLTRRVRAIPTEIPVGEGEDLAVESAASFDNLQPIRRSYLTERVGYLPNPRSAICAALGAMADC